MSTSEDVVLLLQVLRGYFGQSEASLLLLLLLLLLRTCQVLLLLLLLAMLLLLLVSVPAGVGSSAKSSVSTSLTREVQVVSKDTFPRRDAHSGLLLWLSGSMLLLYLLVLLVLLVRLG
jgi:hypothetical protein